jgi:putative transcriptional regulator
MDKRSSNKNPSSEILTGQLLVAEPFMSDPYFNRAVIQLCEHNEDGALGFIINKPIDMALQDLIPGLESTDLKVFYGGPVQTDSLQYLHNAGHLLEDSRMVSPGIYWGGDFEKVKFLLENRLILSDNIRFYIGYSGWSEGQLEEELSYGSWLLGQADPNYLFKLPPSDVWKQVLEVKGGNYSVISAMPEENILN